MDKLIIFSTYNIDLSGTRKNWLFSRRLKREKLKVHNLFQYWIQEFDIINGIRKCNTFSDILRYIKPLPIKEITIDELKVELGRLLLEKKHYEKDTVNKILRDDVFVVDDCFDLVVKLIKNRFDEGYSNLMRHRLSDLVWGHKALGEEFVFKKGEIKFSYLKSLLFDIVSNIDFSKYDSVDEIYMFIHSRELGEPSKLFNYADSTEFVEGLNNHIESNEEKSNSFRFHNGGLNWKLKVNGFKVNLIAFKHEEGVPAFDALTGFKDKVRNEGELFDFLEKKLFDNYLFPNIEIDFSAYENLEVNCDNDLLEEFDFSGYFFKGKSFHQLVDSKVSSSDDLNNFHYKLFQSHHGKMKINIVYLSQNDLSTSKIYSKFISTFFSAIKDRSDNDFFIPIIVISDVDDLSMRGLLDKKLPPRLTYFDSSIWLRFLSISDPGQLQDKLCQLLKYFKSSYDNQLYQKNVCLEYIEYKSRSFNESYLWEFGAHADRISPSYFPTETAANVFEKEIGEKVRKKIKLYSDKNKAIKMDILLVDDYAEKNLKNYKPFQREKSASTTKKVIISHLISEYNELFDFRIDTCSSASAAVQKLEENPYDIIFLDHLFDVEDGVEYSPSFFKGIIKSRKIKFGLQGKLWIFPITVHRQAMEDDINDLNLSLYDEKWILVRGADPVNTPNMFKRNFLNLVQQQLDLVLFSIDDVIDFFNNYSLLFEEHESANLVKIKNWAIDVVPNFRSKFFWVGGLSSGSSFIESINDLGRGLNGKLYLARELAGYVRAFLEIVSGQTNASIASQVDSHLDELLPFAIFIQESLKRKFLENANKQTLFNVVYHLLSQ